MSGQDTGISRRSLVAMGALGALAASLPATAKEAKTRIDPAVAAANPESVEALVALYDSYAKAFSSHDAAGVVAAFAEDAVILGTGPGEIWGGRKEISQAYKNFFQGFDPGKQESEVLFRAANVIGGMAWLMAVNKVKFTKGADSTEFGVNSTVVFEKVDGKWLIRLLHFSNLTAAAKA